MNDRLLEDRIKVSVIVPVYNAEKYLNECIESIINQELQELEIILVDDGSTDNSLSICKDYAKKDKRVQVIHQLNQGVSTARNIGMKVAKGEFIAFVDADDWIEKQMYTNMYKRATEYKAEVVVCNYIEDWPGKKVFKSHHISKKVLNTKEEKEVFVLDLIAGKYLNEIENRTAFRGSCFYLYRNEVLHTLNNSFEKELPIGEDFIFNLRILPYLKCIGVTQKAYYHYRINECSSTQRYRQNYYEEQQRLIKAVEAALMDCGLKKQAKEKLKLMKITYLITRVVNECHRENKKPYKKKIKTIKDMCSERLIQELLQQFDATQFTKSRRVWFNLYKNKHAIILYNYYRLKFILMRMEGRNE